MSYSWTILKIFFTIFFIFNMSGLMASFCVFFYIIYIFSPIYIINNVNDNKIFKIILYGNECMYNFTICLKPREENLKYGIVMQI